MGEQYKQLQFRDRLKIEARLNIGYKPKQIAADLGVHVSTIYREVKRGTYTHMNSDLTTDNSVQPWKLPRHVIKKACQQRARR